jgi:hypothetical protein
MPNGDYSLFRDDWKRIRAFFEERSAILLGFATAHNLAVDKYYHDAPSWTFRFRHPKGGGAGVHVERVDDSTVRVGKLWFIDEYENYTHYVKSEVSGDLLLAAIQLREVLEESLKDIAGWNKSDMTAYGGYEKFRSKYAKDEWLELFSEKRLPELKQ